MKLARVLVIGLGSIGSRHASVLARMGMQVAVVTRRVDSSFVAYFDVRSAILDWHPEYIVVANPTSEHYGTLVEIASLGYQGSLLVEKPLFSSSVKTIPSSLPSGYVGYNLRAHPLIRLLRAGLKGQTVANANFHVGQYLPDWRPGSNYAQSYSAYREKGGGVLRDLSHELDLCLWLFGAWESVVGECGHFSDLQIGTEDAASVLLRMERCPLVAISLDYLDRRARRSIVVNTLTDTLEVDLKSGTFRDGFGEQSITISRDDTYLRQHEEIINRDQGELCSLEEGMEVLRLIEAIELSRTRRSWIEHA